MSSHLQFDIRVVAETGSTNADIKALIAAAAGPAAGETAAPEGIVIRAAKQTQGYGRRGHAWESPVGGLYASFLLRPATNGRGDLSTLPLVAGLAALAACRRTAPAGVFGLKWPNDVYLLNDSRATTGAPGASTPDAFALGTKVCGISVEAYLGAVVMGLGVDAADLPGAPDPAAVLDAFLDAFARRYEAWQTDGLVPLLPELNAENLLTGRQVVAESRTSAETLRGTAQSIDHLGRLLVLAADGTVNAVSSAEAHIVL